MRTGRSRFSAASRAASCSGKPIHVAQALEIGDDENRILNGDADKSRKWRPTPSPALCPGDRLALSKMFLRYNTRKKDGKDHRYWSVVENRRLRAGQTTHVLVLYLGEINDTQQAAWRKSLELAQPDESTHRTGLSVSRRSGDSPGGAQWTSDQTLGTDAPASASLRRLLAGLPALG